MSILIRGMEMPTDCHNCPLGFGGGCYCGTSADEYMCADNGRAEWCPLLPVPPHGDLIDRDALKEQLEYVAGLEWNQRVGASPGIECAIDMLDDAQTIIPADRGAEC